MVLCLLVALSSDSKHSLKRVLKRNHGRGTAELNCDICEQMIQYVQQWLATGAAHDEIKKQIDAFCATLSWPINGLCQQYADQYLDQILKFLDSGITPEQVCIEIGLCTK
uniref:Putative prosaposin n=1 Tax=Coptotermes formosanus TaxID=36987 RepID=R4UJ82_COPFO|nr:putative prosaposin [Coptotermes formosanus]